MVATLRLSILIRIGFVLFSFCLPNLVEGQIKYVDHLDHPRRNGAIIIKFNSPVQQAKKSSLNARLTTKLPDLAITDFSPTLPWTQQTGKTAKSTPHPLASVYTLILSDDKGMEEALAILRNSQDVVYAEPYYLYHPLQVPNDPQIGEQPHLDLIKAFDAWSIEQGDTTITIGILDTGVDLTHPDLVQSIQYNYNDPINGIDDDNDGLTDNYYGWDIANNDNIPEADTDFHGTVVAGASSAMTNNELGVAGTGYKCRFLPIKIFKSGSNAFSNGYEAIALAADLGCDVINLSWGDENLYSQFGQDVINYAVLEKDVAIVAAAGNTNGSLDFYPASLDNVLSVGVTDQNDLKPSWATYSPFIDLTAPGVGVHTTSKNQGYGNTDGSSLSSPIVAGALALVRSRFPELNARQAMERIRVNTDDIYQLSGNSPYDRLLGHGRLNMYRALTNITSPSIRISKFDYSNGYEKAAYHNDTIHCQVQFENLLYPSGKINVTVTSPSPYVTFIHNTFDLESLGTLKKTSPDFQPEITFILAPNTPPDNRILLRFNYSGGLYQDFEYKFFRTEPSWHTIDNGTVALTVSSNGNLGYERDLLRNGVGMLYKNELVMNNIGVLFRSGTTIMDNIPYNQGQHLRQSEFGETEYLRAQHNSIADYFVRSRFKTFPKNNPTLPLLVEQKIFSWKNEHSIIIEYYVTNTSDTVLKEFQPAFLADYDLGQAQENRAEWNVDGSFIQTVNVSRTKFAALTTIPVSGSFHLALDKRNLNGNSADIPVILDDQTKITLFDPEKNPTSAGQAGNGNDVSMVTGLPASDLEPGMSLRFAVVLTVASDQQQLVQEVDKARSHYGDLLASPPVLFTAEYCPEENVTIHLEGEPGKFYQDPQGTQPLSEGNDFTIPPVDRIYVSQKYNEVYSDIQTILIKERGVKTDFSISQSPLLLDETGNTLVRFTDKSNSAQSWNWTFSNGYASDKQNPSVNFVNTGDFDINLTATNDLGCTENSSKQLHVDRKNPRPEDQTVTGCQGEDFSYHSDITSSLRVYNSKDLDQVIYEGETFNVSDLQKDTVFYLTNLDGEYESIPAKLTIDITQLNAQILAFPDTLDLSDPNILLLSAPAQTGVSYKWDTSIPSEATPELLSLDRETTLNYGSSSSFEVFLTLSHVNGCQNTIMKKFIPAVSPTPVLDVPLTICSGDSLVIRPDNGSAFLFYADADLTQLLHKGKSFKTGQISTDSTFYVTSIDNLSQSESLYIPVLASHIFADFLLPADILDLNTTDHIELTDLSSDVLNRTWYLNGNVSGTESTLTINPDAPGHYVVGLEVQNDAGCTDLREKDLQVVRITGLEDVVEKYNVYPNPTQNTLYISGPEPEKIELISPDGRTLLYSCDNCREVNTASYSPGIYFLKVRTGKYVQLFKVIRN